MEFFAHCLEPQISKQGIFDQLPVISDGFFGDGVYCSVAVSLIPMTGPVY